MALFLVLAGARLESLVQWSVESQLGKYLAIAQRNYLRQPFDPFLLAPQQIAANFSNALARYRKM